MTKCAAQPPASRKERRAALKRADLGPDRDPIRQQGRDSKHVYVRERWYATPQTRDRSRAASTRRLYHESYRTSSGHTWDEFYEEGAERAARFEAAGINLGWGGCSSPRSTAVRGSVDEDKDRRYLPPRANAFYIRRVAQEAPVEPLADSFAPEPRQTHDPSNPADAAVPAATTLGAMQERLAELRARRKRRVRKLAGAA